MGMRFDGTSFIVGEILPRTSMAISKSTGFDRYAIDEFRYFNCLRHPAADCL
jgi:hypothetical protein